MSEKYDLGCSHDGGRRQVAVHHVGHHLGPAAAGVGVSHHRAKNEEIELSEVQSQSQTVLCFQFSVVSGALYSRLGCTSEGANLIC